MSNKRGRNEPCSCGSDKKYKRCCLAKDEAAERESARQQTLFADAGLDEPDFGEDDDPEELDDVEQDRFVLDIRAVTRVSYTRGLVKNLSDRRTGRGVWVGEPNVGDPIQVDRIEVETADDVISVEVFNRAISLLRDNTDEMRRIHRVCGALEAAAPGRSERSPGPRNVQELDRARDQAWH